MNRMHNQSGTHRRRCRLYSPSRAVHLMLNLTSLQNRSIWSDATKTILWINQLFWLFNTPWSVCVGVRTLQDFWPGGISEETLWSPSHVPSQKEEVTEEMLMPRLHFVFFHGLGPGSGWDFYLMLPHDKIACFHRSGLLILYRCNNNSVLKMFLLHVPHPPGFLTHSRYLAFKISGRNWRHISESFNSSHTQLQVPTCECQAAAHLPLIWGSFCWEAP